MSGKNHDRPESSVTKKQQKAACTRVQIQYRRLPAPLDYRRRISFTTIFRDSKASVRYFQPHLPLMQGWHELSVDARGRRLWIFEPQGEESMWKPPASKKQIPASSGRPRRHPRQKASGMGSGLHINRMHRRIIHSEGRPADPRAWRGAWECKKRRARPPRARGARPGT